MLKCEFCGLEFPKENHLTNHIRLKHKASQTGQEPAVMTETQEPETKKIKLTQPEAKIQGPKTQTTTLTPDEQKIAELVSRQSNNDWEQITEDQILDFSLSEDPFKLPKEAADLQERKERAYRWCERTEKRINELCETDPPRKWFVANNTNSPFLSKHINSLTGGIIRGDQILLWKPWKWHQVVKDAVNASSKAMYDSRELDKGGRAKIQSHDDRNHMAVVSGERAHVRDGANVISGENDGGDQGEMVAAN
jgi:hypothetical protein